MTTEEKIRKDARKLPIIHLNLSQSYRFGKEIKIDCSRADLYSRQSVSQETCLSTNAGTARSNSAPLGLIERKTYIGKTNVKKPYRPHREGSSLKDKK